MSKEKIKILFVCMGNICRSPTAEGVFRYQMKKHKVEHLFEIDSAGTHAYHVGEAPDSRSQLAAKSQGVDMSYQRARQVNESDFYHYDCIFAMDKENLVNLQFLCPAQHQHKLALILSNEKSVPDPYFEGKFDLVFNLLNDASDVLLQNLIKKNESTS